MKKVFFTLAASTLFAACASAPRADISATADPHQEIQQLEADIQKGYERHYDVLAYADFKKSRNALEDAREGMADNDDREDVIEDLSEARGYLNRATATVEKRATRLDGVLNARLAAINAGARNFPAEKETLEDLDEDLYDVAEDISDMEPRDFDELQKGYLALEAKAVQATHLGTARAQVAGAIDDSAKRYTPKTLARAQQDIANAENIITTNVRNPSGYSAAVAKANGSSRLLTQVLMTAKKDDRKLPEDVALEIVMKDRKLSNLNDELNTTQTELSSTEALYRTQSARLNDQTTMITNQKMELAINNAIQSVAKEFPKEDAEVYRQGNKVLIRLKGMRFASGRAELPKDSLALLNKVKTVASELNSSAIVVEGHTDSVGAAALNKDLSQKRADAVAEYLSSDDAIAGDVEAVGFGFEKPITSNKTKDGRAQNRRVDVVITPQMAQASTPTDSDDRAPASIE